jgi:hypothetical protein
MIERTGTRSAAVSAMIVLAEIAVIDFLYWARVTTNIVSPGRFHPYEPALNSDFFVFLFAPAVGTMALARMFSFTGRFGKPKGYATAAALSAVAFYLALLIGLNTWGS